MTVSRADDRVETTIRLNRPRSPASHSAPADATATSRRSPRRRRVLLAGAAIVLAATACLAYFGGRLNAVAVADGQGAPRARAKLGFTGGSPLPGGGEGERARLETVAATVVSRSDVLRLTGSLAADELSAVAANTGGIQASTRYEAANRSESTWTPDRRPTARSIAWSGPAGPALRTSAARLLPESR